MAKNKNVYLNKSIPENDWTSGSVIGKLLSLSWPIVVVEALFVAGQIVDMIWVGRLGPSSIAGVGIANICVLIVLSMDVGLIMGVRAIVARCVGAGDIRGANHVAGQAFILGAFWGILVMIMGLFAVEPIMGLFAEEAEVINAGVLYLRVIFVGWVAMMILVVGIFSMQASGDTVRAMITELCIRILHVAICPFLVMGWWIFPPLGVTGAAMSNVIAHSLGAVIVVWLLFRGRTRLRLSLRDCRPLPITVWRILRIGIPVLVLHMQKSLGDLVLMWIIIPFGTLAVAAHSLVIRVEMVFLAIGFGLGGGSGVLVGQNLGADEPKRAEKSGWLAIALVEALMLAFSIAILLKSDSIIGIFTSEPDLIELGGIFLRIGAAGYLLLGSVLVLQDSIAGAGDTIPTMIVSIAMIWLIQLPLAFFLPSFADLGVLGVRWAMVMSIWCGAAFYIVYFINGRWKVKKV
jgi:putative MATE family efflux protein